MESNTFFSSIDTLPFEESRREVANYLNRQLSGLNGELDQAISVAYEIAGIMTTAFAQTLHQDDPIDKILTIAGELEAHPDNSNELRNELVSKIAALKV